MPGRTKRDASARYRSPIWSEIRSDHPCGICIRSRTFR